MNKPVLLVGGVSLSKSFPTKLRDTSLLICWFGVNVEQTPVRCSEVGREQQTNSSSMAQRSRRSRKTAHDFHRGLDACFRGQPCPCWTGPTFEEVAFRPRSGAFCAKFRMPASCPCPRAGLIREQSSFKQSSAEFICRRLQQATVQDGISQ